MDARIAVHTAPLETVGTEVGVIEIFGRPAGSWTEVIETDDVYLNSEGPLNSSVFSRLSSSATDQDFAENVATATSLHVIGAAGSMNKSTAISGSMASGKYVMARQSTRQLLGDRLRLGLDHTLSEETLDLISFRGLDSLLRASRLATVLDWGGAIFGDNAGSADTYALSEQVQSIDAFLSHNWCVPRFKKFFTLAVHFNLWLANVFVLVFVSVLLPLTVCGQLPSWALIQGDPGSPYRQCILHRLLCTPVYVTGLLTCRTVGKLFGCRGPTVFLDKTCIHQVNKDLQGLGIRKLGAFLCSSAAMVVVFSEVYLRRLWTVYEIATFLALHPLERMKVVPTSVPVALFFGLVFVYASNAVSVIVAVCVPYLNSAYSHRITMLAGCYPLLWALRRMARERVEVSVTLANFCVADTKCAQECDRAVVFSNIVALMKATQAVPRDAVDEVALAMFNQLVREKLPFALTSSIGVGLRYKHTVIVSGNALLPQLLDILAGVPSGMPARAVFIEVLAFATAMLTLFPLWIWTMSKTGSRCLRLKGWRDEVFLAAVALGNAILFLAGVFFWDTFVEASRRSDAWLGILVAFACLVSVLTWAAFRPRPGRLRQSEHVEEEDLN